MIHYRSAACTLHPYESIALLCTEKECEASRAICAECRAFSHSDHAVKSLKMALSEVLEDLQERPSNLPLMARIDLLYFKLRAAVLQVKGHSALLQSELNKFFTDVQQCIRKYHQTCMKILQCRLIDQQLAQCLKPYKFYLKEESNIGKSNYELFLQEIIDSLQKKLDELELQVKVKGDINNLLRIFQPYSVNKVANYRFSEHFKHQSITISSDRTTISQQNSHSINVAIIDPMLANKRKAKGKKTMRFKIGKVGAWMCIGVAYLSLIKKNNFVLTTSDLGHGAYVMSYQGYSFHNSDPEMNSFYHSFTFAEGEVLTVTVNTTTRSILFEKEGKEAVELSYENQPNDQLYFCACLSNPVETISIVG